MCLQLAGELHRFARVEDSMVMPLSARAANCGVIKVDSYQLVATHTFTNGLLSTLSPVFKLALASSKRALVPPMSPRMTAAAVLRLLASLGAVLP